MDTTDVQIDRAPLSCPLPAFLRADAAEVRLPPASFEAVVATGVSETSGGDKGSRAGCLLDVIAGRQVVRHGSVVPAGCARSLSAAFMASKAGRVRRSKDLAMIGTRSPWNCSC